MATIAVVLETETPPAEQAALQWALSRARSHSHAVVLTALVPTEWAPQGDSLVRSIVPYSQQLARAKEIALAQLPESSVRERILHGVAAHALIALSRDVDLLVVPSHPTGVVTGLVHGTLALKVAGRSECPTIVVPDESTEGRSGVVVGWADDSTADVALDFAAREAEQRGCALTVVHGWTLPVGTAAESLPGALLVDSMIGQLEALVEGAAARVREEHPGLTVDVVFVPGSAAAAIVRAGRTAQLVVVGSHGRGALGSFILGSVSHDVLMNQPAPVVVVPAPGEPITVLPTILDEDL